MSTLVKDIATSTIQNYSYEVKPRTFFGMKLDKIDKDILIDALKNALRNSKIQNYEDFLENQAKIEAELAGKEKEFIADIQKRTAAFEQEMKEAKEAFDHDLKLKELSFDRESELRKLAMAHDEQLFISESKFTKEIIEKELINERMKHNSELENQKAQFEQELKIANESMQKELTHAKAIADAEIKKAKVESEILYTYDATVLAKKMRTEVTKKYEELLEIAHKYAAAQELISRLEEDKAYFQTFAEARVDRSEDVTDSIIDKLSSKTPAPVTVNVTEIKKSKKNND